MESQVFGAGLVVMIIVYVSVFLVGWLVPRYKKKHDIGHEALDSTDLFLAGRKIPLWIAIFTMTATWVGGGYLAGTAEMVYAWGQGWAQAGWGYALSLVVGGIFYAKKMREMNYTTMLDPFEQRFGKDGAAVLYIPALLGEIFWTAAIMVALGAAFATIIGINITAGIVITAVITLAYTILSGLWAVAYTDVLQLVMVITFLTIAVFVGIPVVGGWSAMWTHYNNGFGSLGSGFITGYFPPLNAFKDPNWGNWTLNWMDYGLLYIFGGIPWHCYFQRVLASKNPSVARWMSVGAGVMAFLLVIPPTLLAVIGYKFDWASVGATAPENASMILPYVLRYVVPPIVGALGLGAVAAAVMSSVDSSVLSASSMFTWNVYRPLVNPNATDQQLKKTLRIAIAGIGLIALILAFKIKSVYTLWYFCSDLVYVMLFPSLTAALYFKKANKYGVYAGIVIALILRFIGGIPEFGLKPIFHYWIWDAESGTVLFPFRTLAAVVGIITIAVVSHLTQHILPARPIKKVELEDVTV
jgi:high affinity choline transporter 7